MPAIGKEQPHERVRPIRMGDHTFHITGFIACSIVSATCFMAALGMAP